MAAALDVAGKESLRSALLTVLERPGMYIGAERLDSLLHFFDGWHLVASVYPWDDDLEIHEWVFLRESVSLATASLRGPSLISRCYGNGREAIDQYRTLLHEAEFRSRADRQTSCTVGEQVLGLRWLIQSRFEEDGRGGYGRRISGVLEQAAKELVGQVQDTYESIIPIMRRMADEPHDELWAYLHFHGAFLMARFLYRAEGGDWKDSTELRDKDGYLQNLLTVHAYAGHGGDGHERRIITLRYGQGVTTVVDDTKTVEVEKPLCVAYEEWSQRIRSL